MTTGMFIFLLIWIAVCSKPETKSESRASWFTDNIRERK